MPGPSRPRVPEFMPDDREHRRQLARAVNEHAAGRLDNTLEVTLADGAATTTVTDSRISILTVAAFMPMTANAAAEIGAGGMYATCENGEMTINHANNGQTDRTFRVAFVG